MIDIPCVIFAGGKSSRMGEDKSLLPFGEHKTLTQYQLSHLGKLFSKVYISCKTKEKFDFQANFIEDIKTHNTYAPTVGFVSVFETLEDECFFAISVDAPFISYNEINKLLEEDSSEYDATIAKTSFGIQPLCGIYHRSLAPHFLEMLHEDNHKLGFLLKNSKTHFVHFENDTPFLNINHPQEYKKAIQLLK